MDPIDVETELRSHLATRPVPRAPGDLAERTRARHRRQRRQQAAVVGVGLAVALVFGSVPVLRGLLPDVRTTADVAAPSRASAPTLYELPTRGALAGDTAWLQAVAALPWRTDELDPDVAPPVGSHRVSWAGDVAGVRIALVLGRVEARVSGAWFTGPAGAEPAEMTEATPVARISPREPLALVDAPGSGASGVLVVVGLPGDTVEYLDGTTVTAAGEEVGNRRRLLDEDGVATGGISAPRGSGSSVRISVQRNGRQVSMSYTLTDRAEAIAQAPVEGLTDPRALRPRVSEDAVQSLLQMAAGTYGPGLDGATPVLLAAGRTGDDQEEMVLAGFTFRSGATVLVVGSTQITADGTTGSTATLAPRPAGTPLPDQVLAVLLDEDVALSGPSDAVTAEVLGRDGAVLGTVPLTAGSGVSSTEGTDVRFLGVDGAVLAEVAVRELGS